MTRPRQPAPQITPLYAHQSSSHHRHSPTLEQHHCLFAPVSQSSVYTRSASSSSSTSRSLLFPRLPHFWFLLALVLLLRSPFIPSASGSALPSASIDQIQRASDATYSQAPLSDLARDGAVHVRSEAEEPHLKATLVWHDSTPPLPSDSSPRPNKRKTDALDLAEQLLSLQRRSDSIQDDQLSPSATLQRSLLSRRQNNPAASSAANTCACNTDEPLSSGAKAGYAIVVPILVILSGIFAGLTLGYMSLDETQLHVLATTGSEKQKAYAKKIIPIRKDGHLLLTTLLIANMVSKIAALSVQVSLRCVD